MARNPEAVAAMKEAGWEIASHGYRWLEYKDFPEDLERKHILEAVRLHTELTGERPYGMHQKGRVAICQICFGVSFGGAERPLRRSLWRWPIICRSAVSTNAEHLAALARLMRSSTKPLSRMLAAASTSRA